jgi:hypothetical protein
MERCKQNPEKWKLYHYNEFLGYFDVVVIAHNGKCADKLMSTAGMFDLRLSEIHIHINDTCIVRFMSFRNTYIYINDI